MGKSDIEWTQFTWNPVRGCSRVSEGCRHCYAERMSTRKLPGLRSPTTGEWFAIRQNSEPHWTGKVELIPSILPVPLRRRLPTTWFVNSMSDLFHESLPIRDKESVFRVMLSCPRHTFQALTKRGNVMAEQVPQIMNRIFGPHWKMPGNIWLGVSAEDQPNADKRIPELLRTPAAVRFVSLEPLLGPINLERFWSDDHQRIDWVIVGGESGPGARPCDIAWIRSIVKQCKAAGVPCFVKQLGARPREGNANGNCRNMDCTHPDCGWIRLKLKDRKGGNMEEWPEDLRVREMPKGAA